MSTISFNNVVAGIVKGTTWGTEADITSGGINLYASSISFSGGYADIIARDFGQGGFLSSLARGEGQFDCTITCDITYGQGWLALLSGFLGTESTPAEQTASQADYLVNFDFADAPDIFWTLGFSIESDRTISIPSLKVANVKITGNINQAMSVTFGCIIDTITEGSANTVAEITALTDYAYETAVIAGANHYFRVDSYSTGTALTSADNKAITGFDLTLTREMARKFALRGASTGFTMNPKQFGLTRGRLVVNFSELENSSWDILGEWLSPGYKMAELFFDGTAIASGVNRSIKLQFPYMYFAGQFPGGHDVTSNQGEFLPTATYELLKASAAPSGMSGVTTLMRAVSIQPTRSTKWTA